MEEILSVILNFLDILLYYLNPIPIIHFNQEEITTLGKATTALAIGGMVYGGTLKIGFNRQSALVLAICLGLMGVAAMPDPPIFAVIILYCCISRIMDGLGTGQVIGSWLRKPFSGAASVLALYPLSSSQIHEIYSIMSVLFGVYGVYKMFMRIPPFNDNKAFSLAVGIFSVLGMVMLPMFGPAGSFFVLMLYPLFLIIGIIIGIKTSSAYS